MKFEYIHLSGALPKEWIVKNMLKNVENLQLSILHYFIDDLKYNRRMIKGFCDGLNAYENLNAEILERLWEDIFDKWSNRVESAMSNENISDLPILLSKLLYPLPSEQSDDKDFVKFDTAEKELVRYAKHGAVSMKILKAGGNVLVMKPRGCMKRFLVRSASRILNSKNWTQIKYFLSCAASVEAGKGNLLERILASELSMFKTHSIFSAVGKKIGRQVIQPLQIVGTEFKYCPDPKTRHTTPNQKLCDKLGEENNFIYCVSDFGEKGRIIDVLCPVLVDGESWNMCFEVKFVKNSSCLKKNCQTFFNNMKKFHDKHANIVFVFFSIYAFQYDDHINNLLQEYDRFVVLAGEDLKGIYAVLRDAEFSTLDVSPEQQAKHKRRFSYTSPDNNTLEQQPQYKQQKLSSNNYSSSSSSSSSK